MIAKTEKLSGTVKQFNDIQDTVKLVQRTSCCFPPHWLAAKPVGGLCVSSVLGLWTGNFLPLFLVGLALWFFLARVQDFKTWDDLLYHKLTKYTPVNMEAYQALKKRDKDGLATSKDLLAWMAQEKKSIDRQKSSKARSRFVGDIQ